MSTLVTREQLDEAIKGLPAIVAAATVAAVGPLFNSLVPKLNASPEDYSAELQMISDSPTAIAKATTDAISQQFASVLNPAPATSGDTSAATSGDPASTPGTQQGTGGG